MIDMTNIAIWGCKDGEHLHQQILEKATDKFSVCCFCDNDNIYNDKIINNVPVVTFDKLVELFANGIIDKVVVTVKRAYSRVSIINQLKNAGIDEIVLIKPSVLAYKLPIVFDEYNYLYKRQWMNLKNIDRPVIYQLEFNIANGCILNCKGCLHFSNLCDVDDFPNADELLETIKCISDKCEIFHVKVLGGEPLLYKDLGIFLCKLRKILPECDISVTSNGILIPKTDKSLFSIMRDNYIGFSLTLYEPTLKMKDSIYETLKNNEVAFGSYEARTDKFEKFIRLQPGDKGAFKKCLPKGVWTVKGKKLYRCPVEAYIDKFYEKYNIGLSLPKGIDVYDEDIDWSQLVDSLYNEPGALCAYCSEKKEIYDWNNGKPEMEDWLV